MRSLKALALLQCDCIERHNEPLGFSSDFRFFLLLLTSYVPCCVNHNISIHRQILSHLFSRNAIFLAAPASKIRIICSSSVYKKRKKKRNLLISLGCLSGDKNRSFNAVIIGGGKLRWPFLTIV